MHTRLVHSYNCENNKHNPLTSPIAMLTVRNLRHNCNGGHQVAIVVVVDNGVAVAVVVIVMIVVAIAGVVGNMVLLLPCRHCRDCCCTGCGCWGRRCCCCCSCNDVVVVAVQRLQAVKE